MSRQRQRWKQRWFMRPFRLLLEHPAYWTLNRRSVTRAFALGLFISFVPLPIHILVAAAAALMLRLNVPAAITGTFLANPLTMVLVISFAIIPVAGVAEQALAGRLSLTLAAGVVTGTLTKASAGTLTSRCASASPTRSSA